MTLTTSSPGLGPPVPAHSDASEVHGRHCQWYGVPEYQEIHTPGPGCPELHVSGSPLKAPPSPRGFFPTPHRTPRMKGKLEPLGGLDLQTRLERCGSHLFVTVTKYPRKTSEEEKLIWAQGFRDSRPRVTWHRRGGLLGRCGWRRDR